MFSFIIGEKSVCPCILAKSHGEGFFFYSKTVSRTQKTGEYL